MKNTKVDPNTLVVILTTEDGEVIPTEIPVPPGASFITSMSLTVKGDESPVIVKSFIPGVDDPNAHDRFLNELMQNAPEESWDRDQSFESVAVDYVRYLESQVMKYRGTLEERPYATPEEIKRYIAAGWVAQMSRDLLGLYRRYVERFATRNPSQAKYFHDMITECSPHLEQFHNLMEQLTPAMSDEDREELLSSAVIRLMRNMFGG